MSLTIIAPECLLGKALIDLFSAWSSCDEMLVLAEKDRIDWTMTHAYLANMGGFGLLFDDNVTKKVEKPIAVGDAQEDGTTRNHQERLNEPRLDKRYNTRLPSMVNAYTDSISPLYRNARLLAKKSYSSVQLSSMIENGSTTSASEQAGISPAAANTTIINAEKPSSPQVPQVHRLQTETDFTTASVEPKVQGFAPSRQHSEPLYEFNEHSIPIDDFGKELSSPSRRCGIEDWSPNDINRHLVLRGMQTLSLQGQSLRLRSRQRNLMALQGSIWILDAAQLRLARELGILERLPHIHEQNLEDQNKGDALIKALALLQVIWLIITLIVRAARHLPSSQLELLVAAFAGCSLVIYLLFWSKPKDVSTTRYITAARYPTENEILEIALNGPSTFFHYRKGYWIPNNAVHRMGTKLTIREAGDEAAKNDKLDTQPRNILLIGGVIGAVVFGGPHLAAWYFTFPTFVEQILWRVAALVTVLFPLVGTLVETIYSQLYRRTGKNRIRSGEPPGVFQTRYLKMVSKMIWFFALPYLIARLYIIVEVFRCLCYLPPEAFLTTWAANVPHLN